MFQVSWWLLLETGEVTGWFHYWLSEITKNRTNFRWEEKYDLDRLETFIKDARIMANERKSKQRSKRQQNTGIDWINVPISIEDEPEIIEFVDSNIGEFIGEICLLAQSGLSVSLKPREDGGYSATIFGTVDDHGLQRNIGLSAFAPDPRDALGAVLWKYIVQLDRGAGLPPPVEEGRIRFR